MIIGVGTDMIEIERVERAIRKPGFLRKCFTGSELELLAAKGPQSYAASFAGKEAAAKALGTGFRGFSPQDVEILRDRLGKPFVQLRGKAAELAARLGVSKMHISLAHSQQFAMAFAVAEVAPDAESAPQAERRENDAGGHTPADAGD